MLTEYETIEQKTSYGIGLQMGNQLKSEFFEGLEIEAVITGLRDSMTASALKVPPEELQEAFKIMNERIQSQQAKAEESQGAEGVAFLTENAKREEITVTKSGLQYEVITQGSGRQPSANSTVRTHYHGTLINGKVFDSSYDRGQPAEFPVNGVIAGWTEALQMMKEGSKWKLYLPHNLAYGERGAGGDIGPYQALIFDVELLEIVA